MTTLLQMVSFVSSGLHGIITGVLAKYIKKQFCCLNPSAVEMLVQLVLRNITQDTVISRDAQNSEHGTPLLYARNADAVYRGPGAVTVLPCLACGFPGAPPVRSVS